MKITAASRSFSTRGPYVGFQRTCREEKSKSCELISYKLCVIRVVIRFVYKQHTRSEPCLNILKYAWRSHRSYLVDFPPFKRNHTKPNHFKWLLRNSVVRNSTVNKRFCGGKTASRTLLLSSKDWNFATRHIHCGGRRFSGLPTINTRRNGNIYSVRFRQRCSVFFRRKPALTRPSDESELCYRTIVLFMIGFYRFPE